MACFIHMLSVSIKADLHFKVVEFYLFIYFAMKYRGGGGGVKMAHIIKCDAS